MRLALAQHSVNIFKSISLFLILLILGATEHALAQTVQTFTTSGTGNFTVPAGVTSVAVEVWGGGGGGGRASGTNGAAGGGGGGGAYAKKTFTGLTGGTSIIYYNVGAFGAGGASNGTSGAAGTASWANTSNAAPTGNTGALANGGGGGGAITTNAAGTAGTAGTVGFGDIVKAGGAGAAGVNGTLASSGGGGGGAAGNLSTAGATATGIAGATGVNPTPNFGSGGSGAANAAGGVGTAFGGGGAGGHRNATNNSGGNGANGAVVITYTLPACSGTPAPGNTVASVNPVAGGSSTVLSLQTATAGSGVTYQWQSSSDNSTWSNISGATNATYTASPTAATYYRCNVTCSGSTGTSNSLLVTVAYCTPSTSTTSTYVSNFVTTGGVTNISNNSNAFATGGYINYSSTISASHYASGSLGFSVTIVGGTAGIAIFVDWNKNFTFDAGEAVYNSAAYMATGTTTSSFTIPAGTANGDYRMRVITDFNATSPSACAFASGVQGEAEDYLLIVVTQPPTLTVGTLTAFGTTVCTGTTTAANSFTLSGAALTNDVVVGALAGYSYSTAPAGTYTSSLTLTPVAGAVSNTIYVKFSPTLAQSYLGNIVVSTVGGTSKNVAASGTGITTPTITTQPSSAGQSLSQNQVSGITALTIVATGTGTLTYRWFVNSTGSTDTTASAFITGATTTSYTPPSTTAGTFYYFCTVKNTCGTTVSSASGAIIVTSCPTPTAPVNQPTTLTFSNYTDSIRVNFVLASGADGYLVVRYPAGTVSG